MKRSKAFILVEILTGMALQAGFILVLCTSFYLMLSFYSRTQQVLNARQKGEKVIAYVDFRIRNAGLGLHKCQSSGEIRDELSPLESSMLNSKPLTLPVAVTENSWNFKAKDNTDNKFKGNRLTLLYAQRALDLNLTIRTTESTDAPVSGCNYPAVLSSDLSTGNVSVDAGLVAGGNNYSNSEFNQYGSNSQRRPYLNSYTVTAGAGKPLYIRPVNNGSFGLSLFQKTSSSSPKYFADIYPGDELMYLKCERMFVEAQNFKFLRFGKKGAENQWTDAYSNEAGILEIYFELDTNNNILDMYVLSSGGINDSGDTQKPASWPYTWKQDYANYTVYVSRASWKLKNLRNGFIWN